MVITKSPNSEQSYFEHSSNNNIFSFVAMSADSVPSSKTNIFQNKLIYCRHFRTYSRCAMLCDNHWIHHHRDLPHWFFFYCQCIWPTDNRQTSGESASLPQYLGCNTVFDMRLRVTFFRRRTVSLQSNIAHRE
jgi:hypothetical protein